jgi:hypothetical protein
VIAVALKAVESVSHSIILLPPANFALPVTVVFVSAHV